MMQRTERETIPFRSIPGQHGNVLQRRCACGGHSAEGTCLRCRNAEHTLLSRSAVNSTPRPSSSLVQQATNSPGRPLDAPTRLQMENRFGHDLGHVRIHTDDKAAAAAKAVDAKAFTYGRNIVFGANQYSPASLTGQQLITHELVHTLQQSGIAGGLPADFEINSPADSFEREADLAAYGWNGQRPTSVSTDVSDNRIRRRSIFEEFVGLFSGDEFDDQTLEAYLRKLDDTNQIEDFTDSDNKARAVVAKWKRGESLYVLPLRRKILLIREMLSGATFNADEQAILDLLEGATDAEFPAIISAVGLSNLQSAIDFAERKQFDELYALRGGASETADQAAQREEQTFSAETVLSAQQEFTRNANLPRAIRENCIEIVRSMAPQLFAQDPALAERVTSQLATMHGYDLKMTRFGEIMSALGLVSGREEIRFNNRNGRDEPTAMQRRAWDTIISMVGDVEGWHIFGLAVFNGYHSVTVLVEKRADRTNVYWADQWAIDPGDDFHEQAGSVSGFRLYDQAGFDAFITEKTNLWWNEVHSPTSDCGKRAKQRGRNWDNFCRWPAQTIIWKFKSRLERPPGN